jgi:hypothetical protein
MLLNAAAVFFPVIASLRSNPGRYSAMKGTLLTAGLLKKYEAYKSRSLTPGLLRKLAMTGYRQ